MNRACAMVVSSMCVLVAGCGLEDYEKRMESTLSTMKYQQKLNSYLQPAAQGKFKELNVYIRPPKPLEEGKLLLTEQTDTYDLTATFIGSPASSPAANTGDPEPPKLPPLQMHVLSRVKAKKATPKKGDAAPAPDPSAVNRGNFVSDVRALLAGVLGPEANPELAPKNDKKQNITFQRLIYQGQSGDTIQVYFADFNKGETQVAIIFDIPPALLKTPIVTQGIDLSLNAFALGNAARKLFNGGVVSPGGEKASGGDGPAF